MLSLPKLASILGTLALVLAIADIIHGPHNGDVHRTYIHVPEFICFFGLLCLLEILAFRTVTRELNTNRWLVAAYLSLLSCVLGFLFFGLAGGSLHGDGGPIATSFFFVASIGEVVLPVSFIAFIVVAITRKRKGAPVLDK
jgi:hypothetical protein